ncbi:MAG: hypothetical protein HRT53_18340 [Colwellia sp.]|nr:hypothetical protein [Colwellia sp.]
MKTSLIKTVSKIALVLIPTITLSMAATAHDPKMHAKKAVKADCSKMDHSKMDMKDPVVIAMMKKCKKQAKAPHAKMDHSKMGKMGKKMDHNKTKDIDDKSNKKESHDHH